MRDRSRDINRSREVRPESGYTTGVISFDQSRTYDRSRTYNQSRDIPALYACIMGNI
jgi:hypothetical protein